MPCHRILGVAPRLCPQSPGRGGQEALPPAYEGMDWKNVWPPSARLPPKWAGPIKGDSLSHASTHESTTSGRPPPHWGQVGGYGARKPSEASERRSELSLDLVRWFHARRPRRGWSPWVFQPYQCHPTLPYHPMHDLPVHMPTQNCSSLGAVCFYHCQTHSTSSRCVIQLGRTQPSVRPYCVLVEADCQSPQCLHLRFNRRRMALAVRRVPCPTRVIF